jgi:uncharacterized membrane protein YsdA (DUF1294 family)/cold shock CspA family protein
VRSKGKITSWNDAKAYGFISPLAGGDRIFLHIKAITNRSRRPALGDIVAYSVGVDSRGRPCAEAVTISGAAAKPASRQPTGSLHQTMAVAFLVAVGVAVLLSIVPVWFLPVYLVVSLATFAAYALDKSAARKGGWRTSESTLHLLALAGGWPGALIAQGRLRHKTRKRSFQVVFWLTVVGNCVLFLWLSTPGGMVALRSMVSSAMG